MSRPKLPLPDEEIIARYKAGETLLELSERFKCSYLTIRNRIPDEFIRPKGNVPGRLFGPRSIGRANAMARMRKRGDTFAEIGVRYGVSRQRVKQILDHFASWKEAA